MSTTSHALSSGDQNSITLVTCSHKMGLKSLGPKRATYIIIIIIIIIITIIIIIIIITMFQLKCICCVYFLTESVIIISKAIKIDLRSLLSEQVTLQLSLRRQSIIIIQDHEEAASWYDPGCR